MSEISEDVTRLCSRIETLTESVEALRQEFVRHTIQNQQTIDEVKSLHLTVFGVDGNPDLSGLKGQSQKNTLRLDGHDREFAEIKGKYRSGLGAAWHLITAVVGAIAGATSAVLWKLLGSKT